MDEIISLNGIKLEVQLPDLDGDGITGGVERINSNVDLDRTDIIQPTEMGETLKEINSDEIDPESRMSSIDMKSRLHQ